MLRVARRFVVAIGIASIVIPAASVDAQEPADAGQELADRYAPVFRLKVQDGECDTGGEQFEPTSVDVVLDNDQILLRQVGDGNPVMGTAPAADDVFDLGEGFYLDFPGDALSPECIYERDFRRYSRDTPATVYAHVAVQPDAPDRLALQYWFFWYYNDWNNKHEGDWEGIQLLFDVGSVEEALRTDPVSVGYAQHEGGERADWDAAKLEKVDGRPVVYSSTGSHASYFGSALYLGRSGSEGFGCDNTDGPHRTVDPGVVVLPTSVDDPDDPLAWVAFEGRWGELQFGPFSGPTGPATKERWTAPIDWHDELRSSSVVVPAGDDAATGIINTFCGLVESGSGLLILLTENPAILFAALVILAWIIGRFVRRTDWSNVEPLPIVRRRRAGQIVKAAAGLYRSHPGSLVAIGLLYVPVSFLIGLAAWVLQQAPVLGPLIESDDDLGPVGVFISLVVGGLAYAVGFTIVRAVVTLHLRDLEDGRDHGAGDAYRTVFGGFGDLLAGLGKGTVIVVALLVSVVGIPWGIRQLVRYQFLAEATVLDERRGRSALDRSSELVRGRWLHTAGVLVLVVSIVGLALLVLFAGIPLWAFSIAVSAFTAILVPYPAAAGTLLYGDARAELENGPPAEPIERSQAVPMSDTSANALRSAA